jgi:hemolysin III
VASALAGPRVAATREIWADRQVHLIGIVAGGVGAFWLVAAASRRPDPGCLISVVIYAVGLMTMLICSATYNWAPLQGSRDWLRRFDHAAIFVMIAGTYTPFTVNRLQGTEAVLATGIIWGLALLGIAIKLRFSYGLERLTVALYLALGWIGVIAFGPLHASLDATTLILIGAGGVLYSVGTIFHLWHRLPFQNAVWHGFVLLAAGCHYVAILHGVILAA